jgi:Lrp/AsnC family leucine-responsive transcriptional regulator
LECDDSPSPSLSQVLGDNSVKSVALDDIDARILDALVANGRATYKELGELVTLSPHAVADRVRRMVDAGVIGGFTTIVDQGTVGRSLDAFIDVRLLPSTNPDDFERHVEQMPAVREVAFVTGRFDYQLRVACRDADDLDQAVRAVRQRAGAAATETRIVLRVRAMPPVELAGGDAG